MLEARRISLAGMLLLPAGLVVYFAFNSGGFNPGAPAYVAVLLCVVLAVRMLLADAPLAGRNWLLALASGSMAGYALLTLLSGSWSHAPGVARVEFDLPLVYLLVLVVFGSIGRTRDRLRWAVRGLALAALVVCLAGLVTRVLPHVWPISPSIANNRLSFPVTYWNVEGLVATLGIGLCLHLSSDLREPVLSRILGAGAMPILASTLLFTFSRGAILVCAIVVVVYLLLGRPRGLLSSVIAIVPLTAIAVKAAYDADLLAALNPTTPGAVIQGHHVATVVGLCTVGAVVLRGLCALVLDGRLRRFHLPGSVPRPPAWTGWAAVAAVAVILGLALRGTISREYHAFLRPTVAGNPFNLRARLTDPSNNGRLDNWKVAWRQFKVAPVLGHGAGTYQDAWARYRPNDHFVLDAHSLYLETLDELGLVGLVLLLIPLLAILARAASRIRGTGRPLYAAVFAVLVGWAIHAAVDWDWEMPVVTVIFFSLGGLVLGRRTRPNMRARRPGVCGERAVAPAEEREAAGESAAAAPDQEPVIRRRVRVSATRRKARRRLRLPVSWSKQKAGSSRPTTRRARVPLGAPMRLVLAIPFLALAVLPAFTWVSQQKLDAASFAFAQGNCAAARRAATSSISVLGNRSEPYEILGYCDARLGLPRAALAAIGKAVSLDPGNWSYRYDLAAMRAAAGLDPLAAARQALRMDPRELLVQQEWHLFHAHGPQDWRQDAQIILYAFNVL